MLFSRFAAVALLALAGRDLLLAQDIDPTSNPDELPYAGTPVAGYRLAWSDEFNGTNVDTAKWNYRTGVRLWSTQLPANNSVSNGLYYLHVKKETVGATDYTAGGIISKTAVRYGYYETRMRTPPGRGWHTSFWMMFNGTPTNNIHTELDVIENDSITPLKYGVNTHRHQPTPHVTFGNKTINTPSLTADFHVLGCEFTPAQIKYFFDGALVQTVDATQFAHNDLNIWLTSVAANLGGTTNVDDSQLPNVAEFDYARFFTVGVTSSVSITMPSAAGVTLADTNATLRLAALAASSSPSFVPTVAWSKVSGPGTVAFGNVTNADTTAAFSAPGNYVLQCQTVADVSTNAAQVAVSVAAPLLLELRQGVNGYAHTTTFLRGDSTGWNSGGRDQFLVGRYNNQGLRPVFSYSLAGLDTNALVQSAILDLWTDATLGTGVVGPLELRPLYGTPVEGTGDGSNASNGAGTGATWVSRNGLTGAGNVWTNAGGDFGAGVLSSIPGFDATLAAEQKTFSSTTGFVAAVQAAVSAGAPLNLLLVSPATEAGAGNNFSRFSSDDSLVVAQRPLLTLSVLGNRAPTISAAAVPFSTNGTPVALAGVVSNAAGVLWTKVGGPGTAVFGNAAQAATTVDFGQAGSHMLRLTAWNEFGEVARDFPAQSVAGVLPGVGSYELQITFTGYDRAEVLTNFPALVVLGQGVFGFDYATFRTADGAELRFFGADGTTELNSEVERWNPGGDSAVWVQVPVFTNGCSVIARWGSGTTNRPASATNGAVWGSDYVGVWHLNSTDVTEATALPQNAAANSATAAEGVVGGALDYNGTSQVTRVTHHAEFNLTTNFELQCWFRVNPADKPASGDYRTLTGKEIDLNNRNWWLAMQSNGSLIWKSSPGIDFTTATDLADGRWHHVAAVHDVTAARLFVDGVEVATDSTPGVASTQNSSVYFGAEVGTTRFFKGAMDEIRFSNVARSSNWVWAVHQNIASNMMFASYGHVVGTPASAPMFSTGSLAGGKLNFQISGDARYQYVLQGSTNLTDWTDLFMTNTPVMPFAWSDSSVTNLPARFYRVLLRP